MQNGNSSNGSTIASEPRDALIERLNDPQTAESLNTLIDNLELIAFSVTAVDGFLRRSDAVIDAVTEGVHDLKSTIPSLDNDLVDPAEIVPRLTELAKVGLQLSDLMNSDEFKALMQSGVLSPETLTLVGQAGDALVASRQEAAAQQTAQKIGIFGLLRALNDPDVQRSLNFLLTFSKQFGRKLNNA